jgi:hypothetical protein
MFQNNIGEALDTKNLNNIVNIIKGLNNALGKQKELDDISQNVDSTRDEIENKTYFNIYNTLTDLPSDISVNDILLQLKPFVYPSGSPTKNHNKRMYSIYLGYANDTTYDYKTYVDTEGSLIHIIPDEVYTVTKNTSDNEIIITKKVLN